MAEDEGTIARACKTLQRYYTSLNKEYEEGKFVDWCEEFGLDEDLLLEEMQQDAEESMLADFDKDTFPLDIEDGKGRKQEVLNIIIKCINHPDTIWPGEAQLPACMIYDYTIFYV